MKKIKDIFYYIQGNIRHKLYYSDYRKWLRPHIIEQFEFRIFWMDTQCYNNGECKICGCETTKLQMANKSCDKPCYPPFMNLEDWKTFKILRDTNTMRFIRKRYVEYGEFATDLYKYIRGEVDIKQKWMNIGNQNQ